MYHKYEYKYKKLHQLINSSKTANNITAQFMPIIIINDIKVNCTCQTYFRFSIFAIYATKYMYVWNLTKFQIKLETNPAIEKKKIIYMYVCTYKYDRKAGDGG